ncbi:MAG: hypothetical protein Fur0032_19310 [Terrimicrobiaceae bacterium]
MNVTRGMLDTLSQLSVDYLLGKSELRQTGVSILARYKGDTEDTVNSALASLGIYVFVWPVRGLKVLSNMPGIYWSDWEWYAEVGDVTGKGSSSAELPEGSYTVIFQPYFEVSTGRLYFANPVQVTLGPSGDSVTGEYNAMHVLKLQGLEGNEDIIIDSDQVLTGTGPLTLVEIDVCDNGLAKKRQFLCTEDPYV